MSTTYYVRGARVYFIFCFSNQTKILLTGLELNERLTQKN